MTFESFLREKHAKNYHGTDDDMVDAFDKWICEIDLSDGWIKLAEEWHAQEIKSLEEYIKELKDPITS